MARPEYNPGPELERFRSYLHVLARLGVDPRLRGKIDLSGVVQEALLVVWRKWDTFQGLTEPEKRGWLQKVLANDLKDAIARLRTAKGDVGRERPLDAALEASSARLDAWLASADPSPSEHASLQENQLRLAQAVDRLSEPRRTAVELHSLEGRSLEETARLMNKSKAAVAQLVHRGIKDLHALLDHE